MATENPPVNGMYGNQYNQPAELAASTPSTTNNSQPASSGSTTAQKADPQEIGWYFVEQYYTTLSKTPERIHLFYSKKSQLVTGVEAEKVLPCVGTKAISDKIKQLDIQDCKVRVLNVDSQSSFHNIVVQVIGEMSNKSEPHHKFVQTFVLAEQPNGYFVLNDIFRYLSDDVDEVISDEPTQPEIPHEEPATPVDPSVAEPEPEEQLATEEDVKEVDEKLEEVQAEEAATPAITEDTQPEEEAVKSVNTPVESAPAEEPKDTPIESTPATITEAEPVQPPKAATPQSEAPLAKKTWASMVGGKAAAVPALPVSAPVAVPQVKPTRPSQSAQPAPVVKAPPSEPAAATSADSTTPVGAASSSNASQSNGWQTAEKKQNRPQNKANPEGVTLAYIKNVNDKVDARILREVLESYGEIKYFDVSRPRNCAFVEFGDPSGYAAAVAANPHKVGSEVIYVEERRPRPNAYGGTNAPFARGGNPNPGRGGRGNMQQRTGSRDNFPKDAAAGRGAFQQRGGKAPSGRGQAPAS